MKKNSTRMLDGFRRAFFILLPSSLILILTGCQLIGVASQALPPATVMPQYAGLAGKSVGIMVWADRATRIEHQWIQLDLANSVYTNLKETAENKKAKVKQLKGATFPVQPRSIIRFQQDNPEIDGQSIAEVAPRLGVDRLIYIEIEEFSTRPDGSVELFRGDVKVTLRVVEINRVDGSAKVAYEENDVTAMFPRGAPKEGKPTIGDYRTYKGLIGALGVEIAKRFVPYPEER